MNRVKHTVGEPVQQGNKKLVVQCRVKRSRPAVLNVSIKDRDQGQDYHERGPSSLPKQ